MATRASPAVVARRQIGNGIFVVFCIAVTAIALVALALILWSLVSQGASGINLNIFKLDTPAAGSVGGLRNAIVGSIMMCALAMVIAVVVGVLAGTWLSEYAGTSRYGSAIRFLNDVLLSAPSILIGLFVYELLVRPFHGFSGFAGAVALAIIAVPVITRTTEDVLKLQPTSLREAGVALGSPFWHVVRTILWRASANGMITGALLAFARISGETAPLLFTALSNQFFTWNMAKPIASLPVVIFNDALTPYPDLNKLAWAAALLTAAAVLAVTIVARVLSKEPRRS
ncbi:MAG TPA: phosphate ABC transporter permease PstA [Caulobacteraceae bacterium]|jgi:phosphate transport system permease protein|nr:phosphate ABC transporter permease PstA [Caulobacteraceae bacterium]